MGSVMKTVACAMAMLAMLALVNHPWVQAASDNCNGSRMCERHVSADDCRNAVSRFTDGHDYSQYTSRVYGRCTAIFRCGSFYPSVNGASLKQNFLHVYKNQPCQKCGSHAFYGGMCQATLNYCANCRDAGDPN
ncbi:hypothetical protein L7F22_063686 [Adiantum nelumboides]|nr:hypothetical protein [Adiantum nelumboides]